MTDRINEARHPKGRDCVRTEEVLDNYRRRMMDAERRLAADWITCPTCGGPPIDDIGRSLHAYQPCPDCVDGMIPSVALVERVAEALSNAAADTSKPLAFTEWATVALLASRQGDTR